MRRGVSDLYVYVILEGISTSGDIHMKQTRVVCRPNGNQFCYGYVTDDMQGDRFTGPYEYVKSLKPEGFGVGDFDMWSDPTTGQGYVWFERPHCELICAELTPDYLGTNGKTTGISTVKVQNEEVTNGEYYDLMGRRVTNPTKGLYIVNGKKVFIK